jgi:hypothetical protein
VVDVPSGLSLAPPQETEKKIVSQFGVFITVNKYNFFYIIFVGIFPLH